MDINFQKKYAYSEVYCILEWLGDEYKRKVPKNLLRLFKEERKFGYKPEIDFSKPLVDQVRQETKDIIAYLQYSCWLEDEGEKARLKATVHENARKAKEERKRQRLEQRKNMSDKGELPLQAALEKAIDQMNEE